MNVLNYFSKILELFAWVFSHNTFIFYIFILALVSVFINTARYICGGKELW